VARRPVYDGRVGNVLPVVDHDSPDVDEDEEEHICILLQREDEREDVVRYGLRKAVDGMKRMRSIWRGHDPLVVRLVQALVHPWVV
jgi:hypothetical protein